MIIPGKNFIVKSLQPKATILHQGWYIGFKISLSRYPCQANIGPAYLNFADFPPDILREQLHATILVYVSFQFYLDDSGLLIISKSFMKVSLEDYLK